MRFAQGSAAALFLVLFLVILLPGEAIPGVVEKKLPADIVAKVDGVPIRVEEYRAFLNLSGLELEEAGIEILMDMMKEYVVQRKVTSDERKKGMLESDLLRARMKNFDWEVLPDIYFREIFLENANISEQDFEPYYQNLTDMADINIMLLETEEEARKILSLIDKGGSFHDLAQQFSLGNAAFKGGEAIGVTPGDVRFSLGEKDAIFSASPGETQGPFLNPLGKYSIIVVIKRLTVNDLKKEIRGKQEKEIRYRKAQEAYMKVVNAELVKTEIEINEGYFQEKEKAEGNRGRETNKNDRHANAKLPYLAWVRGEYIYPGDLDIAHMGSIHAKKDYRPSLDRKIQAIVASGLARKAGLANTPEYRRRREAYLVNQMYQQSINREFRSGHSRVSESEIQEYYGKNYGKREFYSVWIVTNSDRKQVELARQERESGGKPDVIARKYSDDSSSFYGGRSPYIPLSNFDSTTQKMISSLDPGKITGIYSLGNKYAVLQVIARKHFSAPPLESVKEKIKQKILLNKRSRMVKSKKEKILKSSRIEIDKKKLSSIFY